MVAEGRRNAILKGFTPAAGYQFWSSKPNGVMNKGHVAVVSQVLTTSGDIPGHPPTGRLSAAAAAKSNMT